MIQNPWRDDARRDVETELEVDVEGDVDGAIFERRALAFRLDDDEHVDVRLGRGLASGLGTEQTYVDQIGREIVPKPLDELGQCHPSVRNGSHACSIGPAFGVRSANVNPRMSAAMVPRECQPIVRTSSEPCAMLARS